MLECWSMTMGEAVTPPVGTDASHRERGFLEAALDCVIMADRSGRVVEFNPSAERVFGYSRDEVVGRPMAELIVPPSMRAAHMEAFARFVATGEMLTLGHRIELTGMRADGSEFPVELALGRIEGEPLLVCGAIRDLTAAKEAESALRWLAEEQRALRQTATLVARGVEVSQVFETVCAQAGQLLGAHHVDLVRRQPEATVWHWENVSEGGDPPAIETTAPVIVEGTEWGSLVVGTRGVLRPGARESVEGLAELTAIAVANAEARSELIASRARIVAASDEARRRLQRDIHDGAQQRLVVSLIHLQLANERIGVDPLAAVDDLRAALEASRQGLDELRDLVAGLHPRILTQGGLGAALDGLAARSAVAVSVEAPGRRYPPEAEAAIYFLVGEALTNVDKHARASGAHVQVEEEGGSLVVQVLDDGVGGAVLDGGSGLRGLRDRLVALGGSFEVRPRPAGGTVVRARLPLTAGASGDPELSPGG
jgi:PAS domain S-box-containing protein